MAHWGAAERKARARGIGDCEGVPGEGAQNSMGVIEEFEGLLTGVGDGRDDLQAVQPVDVDVGGGGLDSQAGGSGDRRYGRKDRGIGDKGDKGNKEGRGEH